MSITEVIQARLLGQSIIALVKVFLNPQIHQGSKLYFANDNDYALEMVTLDMISEPKVVAYDEDILWFLNVVFSHLFYYLFLQYACTSISV